MEFTDFRFDYLRNKNSVSEQYITKSSKQK